MDINTLGEENLNISVKNVSAALLDYFEAVKVLRNQNILINKHSFTNQIGEWLVETIFGGKRAANGQKGWDVNVNGKHIQVKTHSKAETNKSRFSAVNKCDSEQIDELIIIVFSAEYKIKNFFIIPWEIACPLIRERTTKNKLELNWSAVKEYEVSIDSLPKQEIVSLFK